VAITANEHQRSGRRHELSRPTATITAISRATRPTMNATVIGPVTSSRNRARSSARTMRSARSTSEASSATDVIGVSFISLGASTSKASRIVGAMSVRVTKPVRRVVGDRAHPASMPGPRMANIVSCSPAAGAVGATTITRSRRKSIVARIRPKVRSARLSAAENWASPWDTVLWGRASSARSRSDISTTCTSAASHPRCTDACTASSSDRTPNGASGSATSRVDDTLPTATCPSRSIPASATSRWGGPPSRAVSALPTTPTGWPAPARDSAMAPGAEPYSRASLRATCSAIDSTTISPVGSMPVRRWYTWAAEPLGVVSASWAASPAVNGLAASARLPAPRVR